MSAFKSAPEVQAAELVKSPALLGPWALMWRKFRRHRIAYLSLYLVGFVYFVALFGEFLAPANYLETNTRAPFAPPQGIHFFTATEDGGRDFLLHVRGPENGDRPRGHAAALRGRPGKDHPAGLFRQGLRVQAALANPDRPALLRPEESRPTQSISSGPTGSAATS